MELFLKAHFENTVSIGDTDFKYIASHFVFQKFKKNQFLLQNGKRAKYKYLIVKGVCKSNYIDTSGKEHIIQFGTEEWWITDYDAFFNQKKATQDIVALEDCEVLGITIMNIEKLCNEFHFLERFFRIKSTNGFIANQKRILSMLNLQAKDRYKELLDMYPNLSQRVSKKHIANYLGVTRETLSRLTI